MKNELFQKIENILMKEEKPSVLLEQLSNTKEFKNSPFNIINRMKETEQSKKHHPEGNVFIHTMMVVDEAAQNKEKSNNPTVFMWAAFLHDIGKPSVTRIRKGKITAYDHDKEGARLANELLRQVCDNDNFRVEVVKLVRWHMQILFVAKNMSFADVEKMKQEVDIKEVALLGMCDRLGRLGVDKAATIQDINQFIEKVQG